MVVWELGRLSHREHTRAPLEAAKSAKGQKGQTSQSRSYLSNLKMLNNQLRLWPRDGFGGLHHCIWVELCGGPSVPAPQCLQEHKQRSRGVAWGWLNMIAGLQNLAGAGMFSVFDDSLGSVFRWLPRSQPGPWSPLGSCVRWSVLV